jgi:hypothetical protein
MSRPASSDDANVFTEALSETATKDQKLVAEKADLSVEAADLHASVTDMSNAAPKRQVTWRSMSIAASNALEWL